MATYTAPIDIKINILVPGSFVPDNLPGMLPATSDVVANALSKTFDIFGLALPAWSLVLTLLGLCALGVSLWVHHRACSRALVSSAPWLLLLALSFVLPNVNITNAADPHGLRVDTNPTNIVWNVPQGTATSETFTGTTTAFSDASKGYDLYVQGDVNGVNSPTHDIDFTIEGGDLTSSTLLTSARTLVKSHAFPVQNDIANFTFTVDIPHTLAIGEYTVSLAFSMEAPDFPIIQQISPAVGPIAGGTDITIAGVNLISSNPTTPGNEPNIEVGGQPCDVNLANTTSTSAVCTTRAHAAGAVNVKITNADSGIIDLPNAFTYLAAPTISAISPTHILAGNTARLAITGSNFDVISGAIGNEVTINQQPSGASAICTIVSLGGSHIICDVAGLPVGNYNASIKTAGGTFSGGSLQAQNLPTIASLAPIAGALGGGNELTIAGTGFTNDGTTSVTVGGKPCTSPTVNATFDQIKCTVPTGDGYLTVEVRVTVSGIGTSSNNGSNDDYTYLNTPAIGTGSGDAAVDSSANPNGVAAVPPAVDLAGNYYGVPAVLTIKGSGFDIATNATSVTIGGSTKFCTIISVTATQITCNPPSNAAGNQPIVVSTLAGPSQQTVNLYYLGAPTITAIDPPRGQANVITTVTIAGTNFDTITGNGRTNTTTAVTIGASTTPNCANINVVSSTELTCNTPNNMAAGGEQSVKLATLAGSDTLLAGSGDGFTFLDPPTISSVSPAAGKKAGGYTISLTGSFLGNFDTSTDTIKIGSQLCTSPTNISATNINCTVPAMPVAETAGARDVAIATLYGSHTLQNAFTYLETPTLFSVAPTTGPIGGNTAITITGTNFDNINTNTSTRISLDGALYDMVATSPSSKKQCQVQSATTAVCLTNNHSAGIVPITSTTDGVSATGSLSFDYKDTAGLLDIAPTSGPTSGGTAITITGNSGLTSTSTSNVAVAVGGNPCTVTAVTTTPTQTVTCTTPASTGLVAGWADVVVTVTGSGTFTEPNSFNYLAAPQIDTSTSNKPTPNYGKVGDTVVIKGSNFDLSTANGGSGSTVIRFDTTVASCTINSATQATCTAPAHGATYTPGNPAPINITLTTGNGATATATGAFDYLPSPTVLSTNPSSGSLTAADTTVTINGSNFDTNYNSTTATIDGKACTITNNTNGTNFTCKLSSSESNFASAGIKEVEVATAGGSAKANLYTVYVRPTLNANGISPSPTNAASKVVTLNGVGFVANNTTVTVEGETGAITPIATGFTTTSLTFNMPAKSNTTAFYKVKVTTPGGDSAETNYEVLAVPAITSVSPASGSPSGNTSVTVTGSGFFRADGTTNAITKVTLDGVELTGTNAPSAPSAPPGTNSSATFTFLTPSHNSGGPYHIRVTTAGGQSLETANDQFTYSDVPIITSLEDKDTGGNVVFAVKATDTVYAFAQKICQASVSNLLTSGGAAVSVNSTDTPATVNSVTCTSATDGYVELAMPASPLSNLDMTTPYYVRLETPNGISAVGAANMVIYPPAPTLIEFVNGTKGDVVPTTPATTGVVLNGTKFKTTAAGACPSNACLVKSVKIYDADGLSNPLDLTTYTVSSTVDTSITGVTIPQGLSDGIHTIRVETYGGVSNALDFAVVDPITITFPTTTNKAYMWQTALGIDEPFDMRGTKFSANSVVSISNAAGVVASPLGYPTRCSYVSDTSITDCDIDRSNSVTAAVAEEEYSLTIDDPVRGIVTTTNSIRIEQRSPIIYDFVDGLPGDTNSYPQFVCSSLKQFNYPNTDATTYHTALVNDTRNGQLYRVRRMLNNTCWIIDNLAVAGVLATPADSNVSADQNIVALSGNYDSNGANVPAWSGVQNIRGIYSNRLLNQHSQTGTGYFYSWPAATLGSAGPATKSVCPKGFSMPNRAATGPYGRLLEAYGNDLNLAFAPFGAFSAEPSGYAAQAWGNTGVFYAWTSYYSGAGTQAMSTTVRMTNGSVYQASTGTTGEGHQTLISVRCYQ